MGRSVAFNSPTANFIGLNLSTTFVYNFSKSNSLAFLFCLSPICPSIFSSAVGGRFPPSGVLTSISPASDTVIISSLGKFASAIFSGVLVPKTISAESKSFIFLSNVKLTSSPTLKFSLTVEASKWTVDPSAFWITPSWPSKWITFPPDTVSCGSNPNEALYWWSGPSYPPIFLSS